MSMARTSSDSQNYGALKSSLWALRMSKMTPSWMAFTVGVNELYADFDPKNRKAAAAIATQIEALRQKCITESMAIDLEYVEKMTQGAILEQARLKNIDLQALKDAMIAATKKKATKAKKVRK